MSRVAHKATGSNATPAPVDSSPFEHMNTGLSLHRTPVAIDGRPSALTVGLSAVAPASSSAKRIPILFVAFYKLLEPENRNK
jgi:hypothetical protein